MTIDEFNALPEEARRYIENQKGCLSCGKSINLDLHYKNYLDMKNGNLFTLRIGAINFVDEKTNVGSILYPIDHNDDEKSIEEKLRNALIIYEKRPDMFSSFNKEEIEEQLGLNKKTAKKETK
jgi:hypothetical protein